VRLRILIYRLKYFTRAILVFIALLLPFARTFAQVQIQDAQSNNITNTTITLCGSNDFDLISSIPAVAQQDTLTWTWTKLSGAGTLSISNSTVTQPTFIPTSTGLDYYAINLAHNTNSTNASTATVNVAIAPSPNITSLSLPASVCENDGIQTLTTALGTNQTLTASAGVLVTSGSLVTFDPQGLSNGAVVTLTLTETFTVPSTTITFTCSSSQTLTINTASNVTLSLGTTSFQKCSAVTSLTGGSPSGGVYTVAGFPNAVNSSGQIDPSQLPVGSHTVTYTYTNTSGCTSSNTQNITITGFNFSGASVNFAVSEVTTTGPSPILATSFNGITTYSICSGGANATFLLSPLAGLSNFANYSIDWGDGSAVQSGTYSSTNLITHQYNTAGLYTTTVQLSTSTGCSIDTTINLYFGSTQTLGLSTPGNTTVCLAPGQDSVYFDFEISNWQNDPDGISYTFNSNDGSSKPAVSPLINGGVSQFPFIIYDATTQKAYYRHYFQGSSCNYTSSLGGTTYNNTYSVSATKTAPCPGSQSTAAVGPIVISESPEANIVGDDSVCTSTNYLVQDLSGQGKMVVASGSDFTCDATANGYWEVYDSQWNLLTLPNNKFSLNTGSSLGSGGIFPTVPAYWTSGSNNLNVQFLQSGTYNIVKHIGLTAFGGNTLCTLDIDTISVCVDTIAITEIAISIADTICIGTVTNSAVYQDSINCNSPSSYSLFVFDESNVILFNSTSPTDTSFNWTPSLSGKMTLRYGVSNQCGVSYIYDSIIVIDEPNVSFPPNDSIYCTDTLLVNLGSPSFSVISTSPYASADSVYYFITPQTGWTSLGLNQYGHDSLILWDSKNYTIHARAYNDCGSQVLSTQIQLDSIPNPYFTLTDTTGCSPFTPTINSIYHNNGKSHTWKIYLSGVLQEEVSGINPSFSSYSTNNTNVTYTIWHIVESTNGCIDSTSILFHVVPNPDADFSISAAACAPWTPTITNNSTGNNLSFDWDITPLNALVSLTDTTNTTPTLSFAGVQYPDSDQQYSLTLLATSDSGCTDPHTEAITLYARPLAGFSLSNDSSCGPVTLSPTENSGSNGTINSWQWTVIDSANATTLSSSTIQNPVFNIPASNNGITTYLIQLIVQDSRGCSDTTTTSFYINPTPTAAFTLAANTCTGTNINTLLTNNSTANDNSNNQLNYSWTIDSAGTTFSFTDSIPSHILLNNDTTTITYTVSLTVTNQYGCDSTISNTIDIYPNAIAQLSDPGPLTDCAPFIIDNTILSATSFTGNDTYTWTIIDLASSSTITSFSGISGLNYTIQSPEDSVWIVLTVTSAYGCIDDVDSVLAYTLQDPNPSWALDTLQGCAPFIPVIDNVVATDPTLTHSWVIYDATGATVTTLSGLTPTLPALNNTSSTNNLTYTITHTVTVGTSGCEDDTTITVTVLPNPEADFSINAAACAPWTPTITNNSTGNNLSFDWDITPLNALVSLTDTTNTTPTLSFAGVQYPDSDQQYSLTLLATSDSGCTDPHTEAITLYARPLAGFSLSNDSSCGPVTLSPTENSGSNGTINSWQWTVIDSANATTLSSSTIQNPVFNIPASNNGITTYLIQLIVQDSRGCSDTTTTSFYINPTPTAAFTLAANTCTGTNINTLLTNNSTANDNSNNQLNYSWTIDSAGTTFSFTDSIPSHILLNNDTTTITYTVSLTVTNQYGCDSTISNTIDIYPNAIADIDTTGTLSACAPFIITNTLAPTTNYSNNGSYSWSIKDLDGLTINSFNNRGSLNHTISNSSDSIWIVLNVTSAHGCANDKDSILAFTLSNPDPIFTLNQDTGCSAFNPSLDSIGQSTGLHVWEIFDSSNNQIGNTLVGNAPVLPTLLNNNTSGLSTYTITHTVFATDSSSCDSSYTQMIYVHPLSIPTINSIGVFCGFDTIPLSATSTNNANVSQWTWTIGSDTLLGQNINYYNPTPGTYGISLTTTTLAGCDTTIYDSLTIHSYPVADISISDCGVDTVCLNQSFNFLDASSTSAFGGNITSFAWDFDDNGSIDYTTQNGSHSYSSTGLKSVRLTVTTQYGCIDDTLINIYVNAPPVNSFEITDSALCGPTTFNILQSDTGIVDSSYYELFTFNGSTKILIQSWNSLPNPLPTLQPNYIADTVYYLSREIFNCCGSNYIEDSIIIRTPPVADFVILPDTGCTPLNTIIQIDGLIKGQADSAYFDFGDGSNTSILPTKIQQGSSFVYQWGQLNHVFTYAGTLDTTYYVTLTVFNDCGDSSLTLPVYVEPNTVQAAFGMDKSSGCSPLTVNFTNYSYNTTNTAWCFDWDVATNSCNGGGSVNQNPTWTFTQPGTYTVALLVDNGCGYDTTFQSVTVFPSPVAVISSNNNVCANDSVNFISNSTTSAGFIAGHLWEFGNGDTSILQNVDYLYDTSGVYTVTLTVTSSTGCSDSTSTTINIRPTPIVNFTTQDVCLNDTTIFDNLTTIPSGQLIGTSWAFGDGNSSNLFEPKHVYGSPGIYNVSLTHTSDYGCVDSSSALAIVHDLPQLSFNAVLTSGDSCSVPQTYTFTNSSSNSIQYTWDFDYSNNPGVNTSALTSPSFTFTAPGVYRIALFGETAFGCIDSLFTTILVRDGVNARHTINPIDGCEPLDVVFQDTSIYTNTLDTIASVQWFFGDGSNLIQATAPFIYNHTYTSFGTYSVFSVVTMTSGCRDTSAITIINVYPTPSADFSINRVNINTRRFQNQTTYVDSSITYSWTFSDGQSSSDESPTMTFEPSNTGLDSIRACLKVINSFGCSDSICKSFWVWPTNLIVPNAFAPELNYVGEDAIFLPKGHSLDQYEIWIYDKWGNQVWYSNDIDPVIKSPAAGWDGTFNGEPLPMGVYAWKIRAVFDDGTRWTGTENVYGVEKASGTLTLIR